VLAAERPKTGLLEVQKIYANGADLGFWEDAESFLDSLDVATQHTSSASARHFCPLINQHKKLNLDPNGLEVVEAIQSLRGDARRLVALQCKRPTNRYTEGLESWNTYSWWAQKLRETDRIVHTILTFNYDLVLEKLRIFAPTPNKVHQLEHVSESDVPLEQTLKAFTLKLHGSLDWLRRKGDGEFYKPESNWDLAKCDGNDIGIAAPGPDKNGCVDGPLSALWAKGLSDLRKATSIIFVGYRFPPSDAVARTRLLTAIGANESGHLSLNIVLGPKLLSDDNVRLRALLEYTVRNAGRVTGKSRDRVQKTFAIIEHPLFAEDFVTVWTPGLTRSWP
jgi:hypothetical protein